jgi:hypothetical protein
VLWEVRGSNPAASIIFTKQNMSQSNEGHVAPKHWATCPLLICFQYDTCHHMIGQPPANNNAPCHQTANSAATSSYGRLRQLYGLCHVSSTACPVSTLFFYLFDLAVKSRYLLHTDSVRENKYTAGIRKTRRTQWHRFRHNTRTVKFYMQQREPFSWRMAKTLDEI